MGHIIDCVQLINVLLQIQIDEARISSKQCRQLFVLREQRSNRPNSIVMGKQVNDTMRPVSTYWG
jgi:hypothetical protein